ncbi:MAG: transporter substrate-binding domain-containing protein [Verrucomicrobia bacterium]|nr:transporter substrate-binding domain-containing protein [Verrucomicrobiota bacterium]
MPTRRLVHASLWVAMLALAFSAGAAPLRVGIEPDTQPLSLLDSDGRPSGFAPDLIRAVAAGAGLEVEFVAASWENIFADFRGGRIDVLAACGRNAERDRQMIFSVPHIDLKTGVFINSSQRPPASLDDLEHRLLGTTRASLSDAFAGRRGWKRVVYFDTLPQALAALDRGEIEVVMASQVVTSYYVREYGFRRVSLTSVEAPGLSYELHMAVPPGETALLYALNRSLVHLRVDGTYDRIYERWIGPLEPRRLRLRDVQRYLLGLAALGGLAAIALAWQRRLLRQLARQAALLRDSEQRLSLVLEGSEDAFWDWDMRTGRIARSERWATMLGYTLGEIEPTQEGGRTLIHPDDLPAYAAWRPRLESGETDRYDIEYRMRAKSGEWRWVHDRGKVVARDATGQPLRMAGTHTDITARKRTEAALIESQEMLRRSAKLLQQTQATAHIGGWEVDLRTDKLFWSEETFRLHDTTPADYTPNVETAIGFYAPESRAIISAAVENSVRHGTPYELELDVITAKGRPIRVHTTGRVELEAGRVVKLYGSFRDITAEKHAEEDRRKLHLKMLEAQKLESLGVLAGGIAHDFNNLLTVILANATFARDSSAGGDARLAHIETAARRAADLCRQLLAYAGRGSFIVARTDLGHVVRDTAQLLQVSISKKARLAVTLAPDLPPVEGDVSQLRQVIVNLVINASEALGDNTGDIRLVTRLTRPPEAPAGGLIHSFDLPPGDCVSVEISDTGHGMTPATLARIFDPFFTTKFAGRGLGLAAVLGIVRAHRGALTVESTAGAGTTFRLFFPAAAPLPAPAAPVAAKAMNPAPGGTLLLVDDEPVVLATADALLRYQGYKTVLAADGHEAVHQFRANPRGFAAVLLDLTMPGLDGGEVLRVIRALNPNVRVLIMSGFSEHDILARVRGQGDVPVLRKPFTHDSLLAKVAEVIATG